MRILLTFLLMTAVLGCDDSRYQSADDGDVGGGDAPSPEPDGGDDPGDPNCLAIPECFPGTVQVASCEGRTGCVEVTGECGSILCADEICNTEPACEPSETEVDDCLRGDPFCTYRSECGRTLACREVDDCEAYPTCNDDESGSNFACGEGQACRGPEAVCAAFVFCRRQDLCDGIPGCEQGEIASDTPCSARETEEACRHVSACDVNIACRPQ